MRGLGKVALISGASRGIGRAIARALASDGYDLALNDVESERLALQAAVEEAIGAGRRAIALAGDVSDEAAVAQIVGEANAYFGRIDVLVNNAGVLSSAPVESLATEAWERVMAVNAKGTFLLTRAVLAGMRARHYGRIVTIASIGGKQGAPGQAHYSASKAAVMGFTRVLAQEVGGDGITANCVCPGIIVTEMGRANLADQASIDHWVGLTALRRLGQPEDVAGPVAFLASDEAAFITGQSLNVCGGIVFS